MPLQASGDTKPHSPESPDAAGHDDDRLLLLPEVAEMMRTSEDSLRWLRHQGRAPFLFRLGRRVVAYRSEVRAYIEQQRAADRASA
ncbi:helix-turn-helix transcriptional regulator [Nocardiopsis trehalosi]|uniref:helix-turn-helix transcriptional regulator n=1 Tax=Nocardiopsis trehalosi TaxID=109329 RepID=UPI00083430B7|nr:helix-turn-helix domain-containing protein [Nocardiopsis trehalosi]